MLSVKDAFADFEAHPNFHEGFILQTRINFFKLKQGDVAHRAGIEQATLSNVLNGKVKAKRETLDKIANAITTMTRRQ